VVRRIPVSKQYKRIEKITIRYKLNTYAECRYSKTGRYFSLSSAFIKHKSVNVYILVDVCEQMKWLVRKKLVPCLRIKVPSKTSKPSVVRMKDNNDAGDFYYDGQQPQDVTTGTEDKLDKLLMEIRTIRELLQTRISSKAEDSDRSDDEDEENKNDWKLAAAVFDRFLLIIFSILLVGGSAVFFIMFAVGHDNPHD